MLISVLGFFVCIVGVFSFCVFLGGKLHGVSDPPRRMKVAKPEEHRKLQAQLDRIAKTQVVDMLDAEREAVG